jgi:hypothetical protein
MDNTFTYARFTNELMVVITEAFESVSGIFLDRGTSLFEMLAGITAEEASIPVGNRCATLGAQVAHICFYLDLLDRYMQTGQNEQADWGEVWRNVHAVTPEEWTALQERLQQAYQRLRASVTAYEQWETEYSIAGAIGVVAHTAYHLGEIRQALCTLK